MNSGDFLYIVTTSLLWLSPLLVIQMSAFTYIGYKHKQQLQNIRASLLTYYKKGFPMLVLILLIITAGNMTTFLVIFFISGSLMASPFLSVICAQRLIGFRNSQ